MFSRSHKVLCTKARSSSRLSIDSRLSLMVSFARRWNSQGVNRVDFSRPSVPSDEEKYRTFPGAALHVIAGALSTGKLRANGASGPSRNSDLGLRISDFGGTGTKTA